MLAIDLEKHMHDVGTWVDWNGSCDRFIIGDPNTTVRGIAVAWQSRTDALEQAVGMGCNLFITHEPTFYRHMDNEEAVFLQPHAAAKRSFIEDSGLVIYRCHDVWDRMPDVGIVDSWAAHLGFGEKLASDAFHAVYPSPAPTVLDLAKYVRASTSCFGQTHVKVIGDINKSITKVGIGCGAITIYQSMADLGADVIIGTDDGMSFWLGGAWALDNEVPVILVNHATAEEPGLANLAAYVSEQFPDVNTAFLPQGCMYRVVA